MNDVRNDVLGAAHEQDERRTWVVIALCAAMMVAEIVGRGDVRPAGDREPVVRPDARHWWHPARHEFGPSCTDFAASKRPLQQATPAFAAPNLEVDPS